MFQQDTNHIPVMAEEVMEFLQPKPGGVFLDGTVGGGGHAKRILELSSPDGWLLACDRDERALSIASDNLSEFGKRVVFKHMNFCAERSLPENIQFDGILLDLGVSSFQLDTAEAGFSFRNDGPLDMRMDQTEPITAEIVVNEWSREELEKIIKEYGEERYARRVARKIVEKREEARIVTTLQLAQIIRSAVPPSKEKIDRATRTFQAIRIAVNDELDKLEHCVKKLANRLKGGGRMVVITFHSLEDRIVKWAFRDLAGKGKSDLPADFPIQQTVNEEFVLVTRKPVIARETEIQKNSRSRSAKLRVLERLQVVERIEHAT